MRNNIRIQQNQFKCQQVDLWVHQVAFLGSLHTKPA
jgi:hypothetical protein